MLRCDKKQEYDEKRYNQLKKTLSPESMFVKVTFIKRLKV